MFSALYIGMKTFKTYQEAKDYLDTIEGTCIERSRNWYANILNELDVNGGGYVIAIMTPKREKYNMDPIYI